MAKSNSETSGIQFENTVFDDLFAGPNKPNEATLKNDKKFFYRGADRPQRNVIEAKFKNTNKLFDAVALLLYIRLAHEDGTAVCSGEKPYNDESDDPVSWSFNKFQSTLDYDVALEMVSIIRQRESEDAGTEDYSIDEHTKRHLGNSKKSQPQG